MIGFSSQAETNAFLPIVFHSPGKAGEKQKIPRITIWLYCCSYSDQQSPLESFIDWLNTWHLWGISGINYFSFFFSRGFFFFILDSDHLQGNGEDNERGSRLLAEEVKVEMTCKVVMKQVEKQRVAMERANGIWVKTELMRGALKVVWAETYTVKTWQKIIQDVWNDMSRQMLKNEGFFYLIYRDIHFRLWSALFLLPLGLLTHVAKFFCECVLSC